MSKLQGRTGVSVQTLSLSTVEEGGRTISGVGEPGREEGSRGQTR